jgi:hypothetical protein
MAKQDRSVRQVAFDTIQWLLLAALVWASCGTPRVDDKGECGDNVDEDSGTEIGDGDAGGDAGACADVSWLASESLNWIAGGPPYNLSMHGFWDQDGDGVLELAELVDAPYDMESIHCTGKAALVWLMVDYAVPGCAAWLSDIALALEEQLADEGALVMVSATADGADDALPIETAAKFGMSYFECGYFTGRHPPNVHDLPHGMVFDLDTMVILFRGGSEELTAAKILDLVDEAASN